MWSNNSYHIGLDSLSLLSYTHIFEIARFQMIVINVYWELYHKARKYNHWVVFIVVFQMYDPSRGNYILCNALWHWAYIAPRYCRAWASVYDAAGVQPQDQTPLLEFQASVDGPHLPFIQLDSKHRIQAFPSSYGINRIFDSTRQTAWRISPKKKWKTLLVKFESFHSLSLYTYLELITDPWQIFCNNFSNLIFFVFVWKKVRQESELLHRVQRGRNRCSFSSSLHTVILLE